jgi:hypothetical protein
MTQTIGAAIGAIIVFLFFVLGLYHRGRWSGNNRRP